MPRATVVVEFDQGDRSSFGSHLSTKHVIENVDVEFMDGFCAIHPGHRVNLGHECGLCETHIRGLARQEAGKIWDDYTKRLSCERLDHDHECSCYLGHRCDEYCPERQRALEEAKNAGGENGPNPLVVLAAEAPPKEMLSVFQRLGKLEEENAALRAALRSVVDVLPEESREALGSLEVLEREEGAALR